MTGLRRCLHPVLAIVLGCSGAGAALAGSCTVNSSGIAFGSYQPFGFPGELSSAERASTGSVTVSCIGIASPASYSIALGSSLHGAGNGIDMRYMLNTTQGGALMAYNLFISAAYTTVWGDGNVGALLGGSLAAGDSQQSHTVYGKLPAAQSSLRAGSYTDSVPMTLTYQP